MSASARPSRSIQNRRLPTVKSSRRSGACFALAHILKPSWQLRHDARALTVTEASPALDLGQAAPATETKSGQRIDGAHLVARSLDHDFELEHFPAKWEPVRRRKCEQIRKLEHDPIQLERIML